MIRNAIRPAHRPPPDPRQAVWIDDAAGSSGTPSERSPPDDPERDQTGGTGSGHRNAARSSGKQSDRRHQIRNTGTPPDPRHAVWIDDTARIRGYSQDNPRRMIRNAIRTPARRQIFRNAVRIDDAARIRGNIQDDPRQMIQNAIRPAAPPERRQIFRKAIRPAAPDQEHRNAVRSSEMPSGSMTPPDPWIPSG